MTAADIGLIGRSSSSFTRVARIFAAELAVPYELRVLRDLRSLSIDDYGGNPALKIPSLRTPQATWFGALNVCRELARLSRRDARIVWPETLEHPLAANTQELVLQGMSTEVAWIMSGGASDASDTATAKMSASLHNVLSWLDANASPALAELPAARDLSYLEVTLFCFVTHLQFRNVMPTAPYPALEDFCHRFGRRPACEQTPYRFDT